MSRITIKEADLTRLGNTNLSSEVVYVPGFATTLDDYKGLVGKGIPTLCSTISEFETYFGKIPAIFSADQPYPASFAENAIPVNTPMFKQGDVDPSYVYARELIFAGIPVLYERINEGDADITVDAMYSALTSGEGGVVQLTDTGEYSVKYITTGGYPSFEFGMDANGASDISKETAEEVTAVGWLTDGKEAFDAKLEENQMTPTTEEGTTTFVIKFNGTAWAIDKAGTALVITLSDWGINFVGTATEGDTISVVYRLEPGNTNLANRLLAVAAERGDCIALIDHTNNEDRSLLANSETSVYYSISNSESPYSITSNGAYGAMFTPWCKVSFNALVKNRKNDTNPIFNNVDWSPNAMPASFEYLMSLAYSIRNNASWLAIAGVSRGIVPNFIDLNISGRMTNAIAESYQEDNKISINPITNIKPYGFTIWGNRTLKNNAVEDGLTATSFLNIRNMISDIKKLATTAAKRCIFEQNTDILWINFKSYITPLLDQMTSGYGLSGYRIIKQTSPSPVKIVAIIRIYPIYAVESFDITIELSNDSLSA